LFDDQVELVVFEKSDHVGGRLATCEFDGREYEYGGSILHSSNAYMKKFVSICGTKTKKYSNLKMFQ
jgi:prenylcysteine oxidase/farnesylcysteine lyase